MPSTTAVRPARAPVIGDERLEDWEQFRDEVVDDLAPVGRTERALAHRAAVVLWRIERIGPAEADALAFDAEQGEAAEDRRLGFLRDLRDGLPEGNFYRPSEEALVPRPVRRRLLPNDTALHSISRYEAHLSRQFTQILRQLETLQQRRAARHARPLPPSPPAPTTNDHPQTRQPSPQTCENRKIDETNTPRIPPLHSSERTLGGEATSDPLHPEQSSPLDGESVAQHQMRVCVAADGSRSMSAYGTTDTLFPDGGRRADRVCDARRGGRRSL